MPYTESQVQALRDSLSSGVLKVKYEGREITYRSLDEIRQVLAQAEAEVARDNGTPPVRHIRISTTKGF
jgi:hypothetical protein